MRKDLNKKAQNKNTKMFLLSTTAIIITASSLMPTTVTAQTAPTNSWDYDVVLDGNVGKDTSTAGITDITVTGGNGFVEGNADIYTGHTVNVTGNNDATFAYRDNRTNIESTLNGDLNSNMRVVIIDKDGLFFTENSTIDVQGLVATSSDIAVSDIMDGGDLTFENVSDGGPITNNGSITVAEAGLAAFVSPFVTNEGVINAKMGNIVMAAGESVTLDLYGDGLVEVAVNGELADALIENKGQIDAEGGNVQITAKAAKNTLDNIVNNTGIIKVASATVNGGKIILSGGNKGTIKNSGDLETSQGGSIEISGERFVQDSNGTALPFAPLPPHKPSIMTDGGNVTIETADNVEIYDGHIDANGGDIIINNEGAFYSAASETLRTNGTGKIALNQNKDDVPANQNIQRARLAGPIPVPSIQNAIDAVNNTGTGTNTINVGAGAYNETVRVDHANIILNGANANTAGYDPRGPETKVVPNSPGFHVTADNATINGFAVAGGDPGILVDNADNVSIRNNIVLGATTHGVEIQNSDHAKVQGNKIKNSADAGILATRSHNILIGGSSVGEGNDIENAHTGIRVHGGDHAKIIANDVSDITGGTDRFTDGIHVNGGLNGLIENNIIKRTNDDGIYASGTRGHLIVRGNRTSDNGLATPDIGNGIELISTKGSASVTRNQILRTEHAGILIKETKSTSGPFHVTGNNIKLTSSDGIRTEGGQPAHIIGNTIQDSSTNGINVQNSDHAKVQGNKIKNSADAGILATRSHNILIGGSSVGEGNDIENAHTGIKVHDGDHAKIIGNDISDITDGTDRFTDGIHVNGGKDVLVAKNIVKRTNDDGIYATSSRGHITIRDNRVSDTGLKTPDIGNGIELISTKGAASVTGNEILRTEHAGILIKETKSTSGPFHVTGNNIKLTSSDGIRTEGGQPAHIIGNTIQDSSANGINVQNSDHAKVQGNKIKNSADAGILATRSHNILIGGNAAGEGNDIENAHTGIRVHGGDHAKIIANDVSDITGGTDRFTDGIHVNGGLNGLIENNIIKRTNDDGIYASGTRGHLIVRGNRTSDNGLTTPDIGNGIELISTKGSADIKDNSVLRTENAGILIKETKTGSGPFNVTNNSIENAGRNGIEAQNPSALTIINNDVRNSFKNGVHIVGSNSGPVTFQGNILTDNGHLSGGAGARFESGRIDMSDLTNPNTLINTSGLPAIGLQFDDQTASGTDLRIVNETLGATSFTGYLPAGSFYVRFEDGSILDPSTNDPIIIDGTDASFDGIIPGTFPGEILPAATLQFIEDRLHDADDAIIDGRGQIFVGTEAPSPSPIDGLDNFEDFLPGQENSEENSNSASLIITGLPFIDGFTTPQQTLNDIAPAAGGNSEEDSTQDSDLANINPQAGGDGDNTATSQEVTCLDDALGALPNGAVTYNFGGSFEDSVANASACSSNSI